MQTFVGARACPLAGSKPNGINENGIGESTDSADNRFQDSGRSLVIHVLWNGLVLVLFTGVAACDPVRAGWAMAVE